MPVVRVTHRRTSSVRQGEKRAALLTRSLHTNEDWDMKQVRTTIEKLFREALARADLSATRRLADDLDLLQSGLDSMGFAILITRLDEELGYDPFTMME